MLSDLYAYLPQDRLHALARDAELPDLAEGTALFADLSGFTHLTEWLTQTLGARQGEEAIAEHINRLYRALVEPVERWRGSVIGFAGDALTCWFDQTDGPAAPRAAACALAMRQALVDAHDTLPDGATLRVKIALASGPARRWAVGDPRHQRLDVLAGATLLRVADAETVAQPDEVLLDQASAAALGPAARLGVWRDAPEDGGRLALLEQLTPVAELPWPALTPGAPALEHLRPWLLPAIVTRDQAGLGEFLTEMRPLVVLFARFSGIDYDRDPRAQERLDAVVRAAQQILADQDGTLLQLTIGDKGSSLYVVFGAPVAHEDDPRRAMLAALALQRELAAPVGLEPPQIGLSEGTLLVGAYGSSRRRCYVAIGDAVNLAARLMMFARPGEIMLAERLVRALPDGFVIESRGPVRLKGKAEPQAVFALLGLRRARALRLQTPAYPLPLVGRAAELARIEQALERALAGQGQVLTIIGETGMGKSRLVAEVVLRADERSLAAYGAACPSTGRRPYQVWESVWQALLDQDPGTPAPAQLAALRSLVGSLAPERLDALPLLAPLLGLELPENDFSSGLDAPTRRLALHALLHDCFAAAARQAGQRGSGLLLVLEDLHWIDAASADLLLDLARLAHDLPVLILLTARPDGREHAALAALEALPHAQTLHLAELPPEQVAQLIQARLDLLFPERAGTLPEGLVAQINAQAQGNPFYLEELLNSLRDRGLDPRDPLVFDALELPDRLQSLVLSRLDQLAAEQQAILKAASVIGRRFSADWLAALCAALPLDADLPTVLADLARLDLAAPEAPGAEPAYLFTHPITQEVAYSSLSAATRSMLHEALAAYLERQAEGDPEHSLDLLAHHYDAGLNQDKRRAYLRRAAEAAAARGATVEALGYLQRALELAPPDDLADRFALLLRHEALLDTLGAREEQRADLEQLAELAERLGDDLRRSTVLVRRAVWLHHTGDNAAASEVAARAVGLAGQAGLNALAARAHDVAARALRDQGDYAGAEAQAAAGLQIARALGDQYDQARALDTLGEVAWHRGDYPAARAAFEQSLRIARALGDQWLEGRLLHDLGRVAQSQGDDTAARAAFEQSLPILRRLGNRRGECTLLGDLGRLLLAQGDARAAGELFGQALRLARLVGHHEAEAALLLQQARLAAAQGQPEAAQAGYERALGLARRLQELLLESQILAAQALLAWRQGDHAGALAQAEQAEQIARGLGARAEQAAAATARGHALAGQARWAEAAGAYNAAWELRRALGQAQLACEPLAGLAHVALAQGDPRAALDYAEIVLAQAAGGGLAQTDDPVGILERCYAALEAAGDPRAAQALALLQAERARQEAQAVG